MLCQPFTQQQILLRNMHKILKVNVKILFSGEGGEGNR